jgi:parallel beta-helix repeat protein
MPFSLTHSLTRPWGAQLIMPIFTQTHWLKHSVQLGCLLTILSSGGLQPAQAESFRPATSVAVSPAVSHELFVSPAGSDANTGTSVQQTYRTITQALKQARPGTIIYLAPGQYTAATETFPLVVPEGVTLQGKDSTKGQDVVINGSGLYISSWWGRQNVTLLAQDDSKISGLSVTNPDSRGTGIWIESANPIVSNCTFTHSLREGIFVAGHANPTIDGNLFQANSANGLSITGKAQGTVRNNTFQNTGFGIAIGDQAQPQILNNQITDNVDGIVVSHSARPMLRGNRIANNRKSGLVAITNAQPNLGTADSPGGNTFADNGQYAIYNATPANTLIAVGNQISGEALLAPSGPTGLDAAPAQTVPAPAPSAAVPEVTLNVKALQQRLEKAPSVTFQGKTYVLVEDLLVAPNQ